MKIFIILLLTTFRLFADDKLPPVGEVIKLKGKVYLDNKQIHLGDKIEKPGTLTTKESSIIQIKINEWKNIITIGANSTMNLNLNDEKKYTLKNGVCRWKSFAPSQSKGKIFTPAVSLGVRGTNFLLSYNELLEETEIVMFDGIVHFENIKDTNNAYDLEKNQWGGLGGRFGQKINPPLNLNEELIKKFNKTLE